MLDLKSLINDTPMSLFAGDKPEFSSFRWQRMRRIGRALPFVAVTRIRRVKRWWWDAL